MKSVKTTLKRKGNMNKPHRQQTHKEHVGGQHPVWTAGLVLRRRRAMAAAGAGGLLILNTNTNTDTIV